MEGFHNLLARPNSAPLAFSLPRPRRRPPPPADAFACRAASRWADRLFADFHLLPTAAAVPEPPAAAPAGVSASPFVPLFPDAADRSFPLQVDLYKVLGAEPHFLSDGVRRAFEARTAKPPQYGYSTDALVGRRQILQIAHDTLTNQSSRTEYDRALSENRDAALTLDVAWDKVPGVLCALQEAGEAQAVLAIGEHLLEDRPPKRFKQDVVLTMALAYVDISRDAMAASPPDVICCCEVLERALKLLQEDGAINLAPDLLSQIDETLEEITPRCVLELLALPLDEKHQNKRQEGLRGVRNILWSVGRGGIATVGGGFSREAYMNEAFLQMTSAEQMDFFSKTPNSIPPEWFEIYSVALANVAQAIVSKRPELIMVADDLFEQLQKFNIGSQYAYDNEMDLALERALCSLLVGDISKCRFWLAIDNESSPHRDPKIVEFIVNNSSIAHQENDLLPGLCKLLETWLVSEVFPRSRDTRGMQFTLGDYYDDPKVLSYLEMMEGGGASHLAAAAAIAKLGAQATAALGTVKSSAVQAFNKIFPLIEQLDRSAVENPNDGLEESVNKLDQKNIMGFDIHDSKNAALKIISASALFALLTVIGLKYSPRNKVLPAIRSEHESMTVANVVDSVDDDAPDEPIQIPRMDANLAEDIVRKWQSIKSKALGSDHSVESLQEVLDGNMLKVWTDRAAEIERKGWFWDYTLSDVAIDSITVSLDGRRATVEATIEEAGQLTDATDPRNDDLYDTKYTTRYEMAFTGPGGWKITEGAVLKSS